LLFHRSTRDRDGLAAQKVSARYLIEDGDHTETAAHRSMILLGLGLSSIEAAGAAAATPVEFVVELCARDGSSCLPFQASSRSASPCTVGRWLYRVLRTGHAGSIRRRDPARLLLGLCMRAFFKVSRPTADETPAAARVAARRAETKPLMTSPWLWLIHRPSGGDQRRIVTRTRCDGPRTHRGSSQR
jgi:hypothetical protein